MTLWTKGMGIIIKAIPRSKKVSPDIKSVKRTTKSLKASKEAGHGHMYLKNIKEINIHKDAIKKGEEAKKKIQRMKDTKRAYSIGDYDSPVDPANPPKKGYDK